MKTALYFFSILIILLLSNTIHAITLSGHIAQYPSDTLELYIISNPITATQNTISKAAIDSSGHFQFSFSATAIQTYYIDLGSRKAQITLAPEQDIEVRLPEYTEQTKAQRLNPFFEIEKVLVYDEFTKDINYYLTEVEIRQTLWLKELIASAYPELTAQHILDSIADYKKTLPYPLVQDYLDIKSSFFMRMSAPTQQSIIKERLIRNQTPKLNNPAYIQLLKQQFPNPFIAKDGLFYAPVSNAILSGHLPDNFIASIAKIHQVKHRNTAALLSILGFYEASQMAPQYEIQMLPLMDALATQIEDPQLRQLCKDTQQSMATLCIGKAAPYYELRTPKGKKVPTVLKRKYVLLAFTNTNIFTCQRHLRLLEKFKADFKRDLEIVVVACYQDKAEIERYLERNSFDKLYFTLWENNAQLLDDYAIKALPSYYLIAPSGELLFSPLSSPEAHMQEQLRNTIGVE